MREHRRKKRVKQEIEARLLEKRSEKIFNHHNIYISKNGKDVKGASYHNNGELSHYYNEEQKIIREFDENGNLIAAESDKNI